MPVDAIVIRITGSSVRAWARQILHWRVQPRWYLYALGLPALLFAAVNGALALLGEPIDLALMADRAPSYLAGFAFVALLGGGRLGFQPTTAVADGERGGELLAERSSR